jgi:hypothetical protein
MIVKKLTWNFFYNNCKEQVNEELRLSKVKKATESIYKCLYFAVATAWGIFLIKDQPYLPTFLGGPGEFEKLNDNYPSYHFSYPLGVRYFYLCTLGYHTH